MPITHDPDGSEKWAFLDGTKWTEMSDRKQETVFQFIGVGSMKN